jgi:hypothetical protein
VSPSQHAPEQKIAALIGYSKNETGVRYRSERSEYPRCVTTVWSLSHPGPRKLVTSWYQPVFPTLLRGDLYRLVTKSEAKIASAITLPECEPTS